MLLEDYRVRKKCLLPTDATLVNIFAQRVYYCGRPKIVNHPCKLAVTYNSQTKAIDTREQCLTELKRQGNDEYDLSMAKDKLTTRFMKNICINRTASGKCVCLCIHI
ncbi:hypothetical protein M513_00431 [Trichuris suis]|uniref:Uncharacterized protein n=1 Tax=Trichuris suis TaxID=68888 RepID=A0A085MNE2_9BILA|nr:hypothetical protein M513_00431 [Trichuris suis]